jgi:hypothetical protein
MCARLLPRILSASNARCTVPLLQKLQMQQTSTDAVFVDDASAQFASNTSTTEAPPSETPSAQFMVSSSSPDASHVPAADSRAGACAATRESAAVQVQRPELMDMA